MANKKINLDPFKIDLEKPTAAQVLRFEALKRDGFKCQFCGVDVDNLTPGNQLGTEYILNIEHGGREEIRNLISICETCYKGKFYYPLLDKLPPVFSMLSRVLRKKRKLKKLLLEVQRVENEIERIEKGAGRNSSRLNIAKD